MTSCAVDNLCWWGDKVETLCPCASIGKLTVLILIMAVIAIFVHWFFWWIINRLKKSTHKSEKLKGGQDE